MKNDARLAIQKTKSIEKDAEPEKGIVVTKRSTNGKTLEVGCLGLFFFTSIALWESGCELVR